MTTNGNTMRKKTLPDYFCSNSISVYIGKVWLFSHNARHFGVLGSAEDILKKSGAHSLRHCKQTPELHSTWSVVAEWLGCRTLNQRVVGSNPGEGTA
jgi:hypothetical protein